MKTWIARALVLGLAISIPSYSFAQEEGEKPAAEKPAKKSKKKAKAAPAEGGEKAPAKGGDKGAE